MVFHDPDPALMWVIGVSFSVFLAVGSVTLLVIAYEVLRRK